jgi:hypothetical protein
MGQHLEVDMIYMLVTSQILQAVVMLPSVPDILTKNTRMETRLLTRDLLVIHQALLISRQKNGKYGNWNGHDQ